MTSLLQKCRSKSGCQTLLCNRRKSQELSLEIYQMHFLPLEFFLQKETNPQKFEFHLSCLIFCLWSPSQILYVCLFVTFGFVPFFSLVLSCHYFLIWFCPQHTTTSSSSSAISVPKFYLDPRIWTISKYRW